MIEYEARYYVGDKAKLVEKIKALGFELVKRLYQKDIIFKQDAHIVRVRISDGKYKLEYKRYLDNRR